MTEDTCKRAFVIGLDGARGPAVLAADTPNIDSIITAGMGTYAAQSVLPSASFEAWGAMFHGVGPEKHHLGGNSPCPEDVPWPSFMKLARQQFGGVSCASFSCWEPVNSKIIELSCQCHCVSLPDDELVSAAAAYIRTERPEVFFLQLDAIDGAGHTHGYRSSEYLHQISASDAHVGTMLGAIADADLMEDSLLIVLSDHGGVDHSHGSDHPDCLTTFWSCRGPGIARRGAVDSGLNIMDTAAVVARALGLAAPTGWDARVPEGLFAETSHPPEPQTGKKHSNH